MSFGLSSSSSMSATGSLIGKTAPAMMRVSPLMSMKMTMALPSPPSFMFRGRVVVIRSRSRSIRCEVAVEESSSMSTSEPKIGARVRVKVPLKVYHVPKVPEVDLNGMEGEIKQYVALWKGKRISANFPYKVQFLFTEDTNRGPVKFFAHLKEDEFEYI